MIRRLADGQEGVVSRVQLLAAGVSARTIESRVSIGQFVPMYPGVYRVGHSAPSALATYIAATLACGDGAALSGGAAAWLWGLVKGRPPAPEVSCPTRRRIEGIRTRQRRLHPGEVTTYRGIRVTTVPLILIDLASSLPQFELGKACHEAGVKYRTTPAQVNAVLKRRPNAKGAATLRRILEGEPISLSRLEARFLKILREAGLPLPLTNKPAGGRRVDCRWPEHGLTVELDSYRFHNTRHAWEQDRRREREAYARGDEFKRFSYDDVFVSPAPVVAEVRASISQRGRKPRRS